MGLLTGVRMATVIDPPFSSELDQHARKIVDADCSHQITCKFGNIVDVFGQHLFALRKILDNMVR
jgi:hypothetical protein